MYYGIHECLLSPGAHPLFPDVKRRTSDLTSISFLNNENYLKSQRGQLTADFINYIISLYVFVFNASLMCTQTFFHQKAIKRRSWHSIFILIDSFLIFYKEGFVLLSRFRSFKKGYLFSCFSSIHGKKMSFFPFQC